MRSIVNCQTELDALYRETFTSGTEEFAQSGDHPVEPIPECYNGQASSLTDAQISQLAAKAKNGHKFNKLWSGDTTGYDSPSEADQGLCNMLAFWSGGDQTQTERMFRASGLFREGKARQNKDYVSRTVASAIKFCNGVVYVPKAKRLKQKTAAIDRTPLAVNSLEARTDIANAARLVKLHGDKMRYCFPWKRWLIWSGMHWQIDETGAALRLAKNVAEVLFREAAKNSDQLGLVWAAQTANHRRLEAMLALAAPELHVLPKDLDRNPWLLNCDNGTLDLKTGEIREHRREDLLTKLCPTAYNRNANTAVWDRFLKAVFVKKTLIDFIRRFFGYCLTGDVREQLLPIFWGGGSNGKSTLLEAFMHAIGGDYAMKAPPDLLIAKKNDAHPTERADLFGKRFVACVESGQGRGLNETLVKELTGGDTVRARRLYENNWEFKPTHKAVLCTNHCPDVLGTDHAIWRRLGLVPFVVTFWDASKGETGPDELKQDKALPARLREAAEGILAWCVQGCLDWQRNGLNLPPEIMVATEKYRHEQDVVALFIDECCLVSPTSRVRAGELFTEFEKWCEREGRQAIGNRLFGEAMSRKFTKKPNNGLWYLGVEVATKGEE